MSWSTHKGEGGIGRLDLGSASASAASASTAEHVGDAIERCDQRRRDGRHTLSAKQKTKGQSQSRGHSVARLEAKTYMVCRMLPMAEKMVWNRLAMAETIELRHDATAGTNNPNVSVYHLKDVRRKLVQRTSHDG